MVMNRRTESVWKWSTVVLRETPHASRCVCLRNAVAIARTAPEKSAALVRVSVTLHNNGWVSSAANAAKVCTNYENTYRICAKSN